MQGRLHFLACEQIGPRQIQAGIWIDATNGLLELSVKVGQFAGSHLAFHILSNDVGFDSLAKLFTERFSADERSTLAELLGRLPGGSADADGTECEGED